MKLKATFKSGNNNDVRREIGEFANILRKFNEKFEELIESDYIGLQVGKYKAETYFCPETWEETETMIRNIIRFLIVWNELDQYPYYRNMMEEFNLT